MSEQAWTPGFNADEWEVEDAIFERPEWHRYAMCRGMAYTEPDLFFPQRGQSRTQTQALSLCRVCPVIKQCREFGLWQIHGVWGGLTERARRNQRRQIPVQQRKPLTAPTRTPSACGTDAGYKRHQRHGETPCLACQYAHNRYRNPNGEHPKGQRNGAR